jgi:glycosyltransferase involved in cell wall biosynthesis
MESVSVVIPVCNRIEELKRAINSALSQVYRVSEIIVVENNSIFPDEIKRVCDDFDHDIVCFFSMSECNNANQARNYGTKLASSDWVFYLDSDDEWHSNHIKNCMDEISRTGCNFIYGGATIYDGFQIKYRPSVPIKANSRKHPIDILLGPKGFAQSSSFGIKRSVTSEVFWDENVYRHQDYEFFLASCLNLKVAFNNNMDYTIYWKKGEVRSFDFESVKKFFNKWKYHMSTLTRIRYILIMLKVTYRDGNWKAFLFYLKSLIIV